MDDAAPIGGVVRGPAPAAALRRRRPRRRREIPRRKSVPSGDSIVAPDRLPVTVFFLHVRQDGGVHLMAAPVVQSDGTLIAVMEFYR